MSAPDALAYSEADLDRLGILSRSTRYRLRRRGQFPEPVRPPLGTALYRATDIKAWLQDPSNWKPNTT